MSQRWSTDDVWALAPDASSRAAARKVARPASWTRSGWCAADNGTVSMVWGEYKGGGAKPYQAAAHLTAPDGPAFRCSCPSRKFPCKHTLAVLYLWALGEVPGPVETPEWVAEWRDRRAARAATKRSPAPPANTAASQKTLRARERLVEAGLTELELWLADQIEAGLAEAPRREYRHWERMAQRLVDAKAATLARRVEELGTRTSAPDWPDQLLAEFALLRLLATGYRRGEELPERTRAAIRERIGFTVRTEDLLASGERVRDTWEVLCRRDLAPGRDRISARRVWLRGRGSGRVALSLSFAAPGEALDPRPRVGTALDADLVFYPSGHRAVLTEERGEAAAATPAGAPVEEALRHHADELAVDPWLDAWPMVLAGARIARRAEWALVDPSGAALPLRADPHRLLAVTGGHPATVAAEWTPQGLYPLTVWDPDGRAVTL